MAQAALAGGCKTTAFVEKEFRRGLCAARSGGCKAALGLRRYTPPTASFPLQKAGGYGIFNQRIIPCGRGRKKEPT